MSLVVARTSRTRSARRGTVAATLGLLAALALTACSSSDPVGVWIDENGDSAFINDDGSCSGMYWNGGSQLDIGGPMTCSFSGSTLVVSQPPNEITYSVSFDGDVMTIQSGSEVHEYTRAD